MTKKKKKAIEVTDAVIVSSYGDELDDLMIVKADTEILLFKKLRMYLIGPVQSFLASRKQSRAKSIVGDIIEDLLDKDDDAAFSVSGHDGFIQVQFNPHTV